MGKIKEIILSKIHKGNHIIQYKRSHMHPLLNKKYFNDTFGYFTITKMWNIKNIDLTSWFSYEKNRNIC